MSDERSKKTCAVPRPNWRPGSKRRIQKRSVKLPIQRRRSTEQHHLQWNRCAFPAAQPGPGGRSFSVAIVGSNLPDMNGLTLAKIAKADAPPNATDFIIAAASTKLPDETQITTAGVTACLIRPIRQSQFVSDPWAKLSKGPFSHLNTSARRSSYGACPEKTV